MTSSIIIFLFCELIGFICICQVYAEALAMVHPSRFYFTVPLCEVGNDLTPVCQIAVSCILFVIN